MSVFLAQELIEEADYSDVSLYLVGYEAGEWRLQQWVKSTFRDHLLTFGLTYSEFQTVNYGNAASQLSRAARMVYDTENYKRRGEFGELFLHGILRDFFGAEPAISKIFFLDGPNETAKGFDGVHVILDDEGELTLWLGESKLYGDVRSGIRDAVRSLEDHIRNEFLRREFLAVTNKLDAAWPHRERLKELLDETTSLDQVLEKIRECQEVCV